MLIKYNSLMHGTVKVFGGNRLVGEVEPIPNKNSILAALPAAVLSDKEIVYKNIPKTSDVGKLLEILKKLGAVVDDSDYSNLRINCKDINSHVVDRELGGQFRGSLMFVGPLLSRFGIAEVPLPGGCVLGMRSIEAHVNVFTKVGVKVERVGDMVRFTAPTEKQRQYSVWQVEASVTATENFVIYASGVEAEFELINAASEPHVSDLLGLLSEMGAVVAGKGSNRLKIRGVSSFKPAVFVPSPDFVDIAGYTVGAAITDGGIVIKGANLPEIIGGMRNYFEMFGVSVLQQGSDLVVRRGGELVVDVDKSGFPLAAPDLPKLNPGPWPGFPVDVLPVMLTLALASRGRILMHNWMYEAGFAFVRELNDLGANIFELDPQRVIVTGPVKLTGGEVVSPAIIQGCKAIFLASLMSPVETIIHGVDILQRRYPDIFSTYKKLGADIETI